MSHCRELARRELMEEAGAVLDREARYLSAHVADSARERVMDVVTLP